MTATNHALTGAVIALAIDKPLLAIPLALLSHFALDIIPHYNPPGVTNQGYVSHTESWRKKMRIPSFRYLFALDMLLFISGLILIPWWGSDVTAPWVIFTCMIAGAAPDFTGGIEYLYFLATGKKIGASRLDKWHAWLQWRERPWGIWVELIYFLIILEVIHNLIA